MYGKTSEKWRSHLIHEKVDYRNCSPLECSMSVSWVLQSLAQIFEEYEPHCIHTVLKSITTYRYVVIVHSESAIWEFGSTVVEVRSWTKSKITTWQNLSRAPCDTAVGENQGKLAMFCELNRLDGIRVVTGHYFFIRASHVVDSSEDLRPPGLLLH
jgi:hypothetical protein